MLNIINFPILIYRKIFKRDSYNIGVVNSPIHCFLDNNFKPIIHWLPKQSRTGAFIADPFGIEFEGKRYLFCEYFDYGEPKGRIIGAEIKGTAVVGDFSDVIIEDCHLSYPYVFTYNNDVYCIPESSRINKLVLYKMKQFPSTWVKEVNLFEIDAVDSSIIYFNERWWLFYGLKSTGGGELFVSYADTPYGPWLPHALQPVKRDPSSSRSGGTPFVHEGRLYRPAQDCSKVYGGRIVINEVTVLTPDEFVEKEVAVVEPDKSGPYPDGLHTLSSLGNLTLIDSKREKFILAALVRSTTAFIRKICKIERPMDL